MGVIIINPDRGGWDTMGVYIAEEYEEDDNV